MFGFGLEGRHCGKIMASFLKDSYPTCPSDRGRSCSHDLPCEVNATWDEDQERRDEKAMSAAA